MSVSEPSFMYSWQLNLSKRLVNKIVRTYFKQNYDEEIATAEEFQQLYETVVK